MANCNASYQHHEQGRQRQGQGQSAMTKHLRCQGHRHKTKTKAKAEAKTTTARTKHSTKPKQVRYVNNWESKCWNQYKSNLQGPVALHDDKHFHKVHKQLCWTSRNTLPHGCRTCWSTQNAFRNWVKCSKLTSVAMTVSNYLCISKLQLLATNKLTTDQTRSSAIRRESAHLTWLYCTVQMAFQYETV